MNCYSSSGVRFSLSGQAAEPQGGRLLCLRLLLSGFYVTRFKVANDLGNEMGDLFREFFTEAIQLLDWAHVQARSIWPVCPLPPSPLRENAEMLAGQELLPSCPFFFWRRIVQYHQLGCHELLSTFI